MKLENDLGRDPIGKLVMRVAIPSMLAQFVSVLYSIVDRMYIGNIPEVGKLALAGAGVCGPIITFISGFAFWIGMGGSPLVSIRMGQKDHEGAERLMADSFLLLTLMSLVLTGTFLVIREPVLRVFGASPKLLPFALDYFTTYVLGTFFALVSTGMNQFIICQGFAKKGMQSVMLGAVLNILLDPLFIFGFKMGIQGAALATVISQMASCSFVLYFLFGKIPPVRITFHGYRLREIGRVLFTGLPPFFIYAMEGIMVIAMNAVLQKYGGPERGDLLVAAATISQSFLLVVVMPLGGITAGTGSILGYNFGAGRPDRILEAQKRITALALGYTGLLFLIGQFFPAPFTHIFTPDAQVSAEAVRAIRMATLSLIPLGVQYVIVDGWTGMGLMQLALPMSVLRKFTYLAFTFLLPAIWGADATFLAEPVSDFFPTLVSIWLYFHCRKWFVSRSLAHKQEQ